MGPVQPFIPALAGIGGSIFGAITGKKAGQEAMQPSAEERGYLGRQGQLSDMLKGQASTTFGTGMPGITSAMQYYDTMARGDRAKMSQAIAPSVAQITQQYRGADESINRNLRGAQRQQQKGELGRERASRLALLTTGQQPQAYDNLAKQGQELIGHSSRAAFGAGQLMNTMLENSAERRKYGMDTGKEVSKGKGGMLSDILKNFPWPKGGGKAPGPGDITPEDTGYDPDGGPDSHLLPSRNPVQPYQNWIPGMVSGGPIRDTPYSGGYGGTAPYNNLPPQWGNPPKPDTNAVMLPYNPGSQPPPSSTPYDDDDPGSIWYNR